MPGRYEVTPAELLQRVADEFVDVVNEWADVDGPELAPVLMGTAGRFGLPILGNCSIQANGASENPMAYWLLETSLDVCHAFEIASTGIVLYPYTKDVPHPLDTEFAHDPDGNPQWIAPYLSTGCLAECRFQAHLQPAWVRPR